MKTNNWFQVVFIALSVISIYNGGNYEAYIAGGILMGAMRF